MVFESYKKKCSKCGYINDIPADWFNNTLETKQYICPSCRHSVLLKASAIRKQFYNDFVEKTVIVGQNNKDAKQTFSLKITNNTNRVFFEINNIIQRIYFVRGNVLDFNFKDDEREYFLAIPDKFISKKHAIVTIVDQPNNKKIFLKDLNSTNGTILNGEKLDLDDEVILQAGSIIIIGETEIEIVG